MLPLLFGTGNNIINERRIDLINAKADANHENFLELISRQKKINNDLQSQITECRAPNWINMNKTCSSLFRITSIGSNCICSGFTILDPNSGLPCIATSKHGVAFVLEAQEESLDKRLFVLERSTSIFAEAQTFGTAKLKQTHESYDFAFLECTSANPELEPLSVEQAGTWETLSELNSRGALFVATYSGNSSTPIISPVSIISTKVMKDSPPLLVLNFSVQFGASGGCLLDVDMKVHGVIVSTTKDNSGDGSYAMALPFYNVACGTVGASDYRPFVPSDSLSKYDYPVHYDNISNKSFTFSTSEEMECEIIKEASPIIIVNTPSKTLPKSATMDSPQARVSVSQRQAKQLSRSEKARFLAFLNCISSASILKPENNNNGHYFSPSAFVAAFNDSTIVPLNLTSKQISRVLGQAKNIKRGGAGSKFYSLAIQ